MRRIEIAKILRNESDLLAKYFLSNPSEISNFNTEIYYCKESLISSKVCSSSAAEFCQLGRSSSICQLRKYQLMIYISFLRQDTQRILYNCLCISQFMHILITLNSLCIGTCFEYRTNKNILQISKGQRDTAIGLLGPVLTCPKQGLILFRLISSLFSVSIFHEWIQ